MDITVNGKQESISADTLAAYVREKRLETRALVVELNGRVISADQWHQTPLRQGDTLELLSFVGGG